MEVSLFWVLTLLASFGSIQANKVSSFLRILRQKRQLQMRIAGGFPARDWPHHVGLCAEGFSPFICGGSIVNNQWIVTAAHCLMNYPGDPSKYKIKVGAHERRDDSCTTNQGSEGIYQVSEIHIHPHYANPLASSNDIAMLKLKHRITFIPDVIGAAQQQHLSLPVLPSETCMIMGWGTTTTGTRSNTLMEVDVEIQGHNECVRFMTEDVHECEEHTSCVDYTMFCAGRKDGVKDSCRGDSGGSIMCQKGSTWIQAGLVSAGPNRPCGQAGYGVYANMDRLLGFIDETLHPSYAVTEVTIALGGSTVSCPNGYTNRLPVDLNPLTAKGAYLCFKKSGDRSNAISDIDIISSNDADVSCRYGFTKVETDIMAGVRGPYVYLCYKRASPSKGGTVALVDIVALNVWKQFPQEMPIDYQVVNTPVRQSSRYKLQLAYKKKSF